MPWTPTPPAARRSSYGWSTNPAPLAQPAPVGPGWFVSLHEPAAALSISTGDARVVVQTVAQARGISEADAALLVHMIGQASSVSSSAPLATAVARGARTAPSPAALAAIRRRRSLAAARSAAQAGAAVSGGPPKRALAAPAPAISPITGSSTSAVDWQTRAPTNPASRLVAPDQVTLPAPVGLAQAHPAQCGSAPISEECNEIES